MKDIGLLLLVFSAIAIGWMLGRRSRSSAEMDNEVNHIYPQYYQGLNYLLNDRPDRELDSFIDALDVNSDTFETHIAIGNLMRRKGEVDRAIRIHQNLLSRPSICVVQLHKAHLELARDFISAGLLDRAERLLEDLLKEAPELRDVSASHLVEIYQDEKEWQKAIDLVLMLLPTKFFLKSTKDLDAHMIRALSHYHCESAEISIAKNDYHSARIKLKKALGYDRNCIRASLLVADVELHTAHYIGAIKSLRKVRNQDPLFLPLTLPILKTCYVKLQNYEGFQQYLRECMLTHPSATVMLTLAQDIQEFEGDEAAITFISKKLSHKSSMRALLKLLELQIVHSEERVTRVTTVLVLIKIQLQKLIQSQPQYRCNHCGFSGQQLHWLCPSCKHWGEIKVIQGLVGD